MWLLVGLSFAYGIFHAAGPGHGKAVISSYMLANEVALRRGIMLSFVSAFLQALTAIARDDAGVLVLRGTAISMTDATWFLEDGELCAGHAVRRLAAVAEAGPPLIGLLAAGRRTACPPPMPHSHAGHRMPSQRMQRPAHPRMPMHARHDDHDHRIRHVLIPHAWHHAPTRRRTASTAMRGEVCETCGHSHAPDPALLSGDRFDWRTAWSAVAAVGLRPCSGALIVLSFAFLNGLLAGGVLSVLAMALGTAITVSLLATLAVSAKNGRSRFAGDGRVGRRAFISTIEIAARPSCWRSGSCCSPPACRRRRAAPRRRGEDGYLRFWLRPRSQKTMKNPPRTARPQRPRRPSNNCRPRS